MLSKQEEINYRNIKSKLRAKPIHISEEQEKFEFAERKARREELIKKLASNPKPERKIFINCIQEWVEVSKVTEEIKNKEIEIGFLYNK